MCSEILQQICLSLELYSMTHGYATQARCFHVKYTHRPILFTHTTMRYRCEILNHGIHGYEVWLHGRNQGRSGVNIVSEQKKRPLGHSVSNHPPKKEI